MKTIVYFILFLITASSFAQKVKVVDKETGKPILNVTVFNEQESFSSSTDKNGIVDLSLLVDQDVIIFSHISYALQIKKKSSLQNDDYTLYLTRQSEQLDEVVLSVFKGKAKSNRIAERVAVITQKEIKQFLVERYGEYILFKPMFNYKNWFLWVFPFILLAFSLFIFVYKLRKK